MTVVNPVMFKGCTGDLPPVSVVIVCYNAGETLSGCLQSVLCQDYAGEWEVLVVDNQSTDRTLAELERFSLTHPRLRFMINPQRGIAVSRNIGWRNARYDWVAFTDADCQASSNWLTTLMSGMQSHAVHSPNLAAVGGSNIPPSGDSLFYRSLGLMLNSYLGSHSSVQGRCYQNDQETPHLPTLNVLYRKSALQRVDGFDETFYNIGEDRDLSYRLQQAGFSLYYLADATITHAMRSTMRAWFHNMFVYGKGRMWLMRRHPQEIDPVLLLPMGLVGSILAAWWFPLPSAAYGISMAIYSLWIALRNRQPALSLPLCALLIGTHVCYGMGQWYGLVRNRLMKKQSNRCNQAIPIK
ncbi:MAG TPA: glycosyltransferase [bacterium]|nr:glycosyltransferase [bacterium]HPN35306.1 glycosyltransferase [bacterium]